VGDRHLTFVNPHFEAVARKRGFYSQELMDTLAKHGTLHELPEIPEDVRRVFVTAHEIAPEWHVRMQAAFQRYTDNGVSKTINLPMLPRSRMWPGPIKWPMTLDALASRCSGMGASPRMVARCCTSVPAAWAMVAIPARTRCWPRPRGQGGRDEGEGRRGRGCGCQDRYHGQAAPAHAAGVTYRIDTPLGTGYVHVNQGPSGEPFEVFLNVGKAGSDVQADAEALGRLISLVLRMPSPLSPRDRVEEMVKQLDRIGGRRDRRNGAGAGPLDPGCHRPGPGGARGTARARGGTPPRGARGPGAGHATCARTARTSPGLRGGCQKCTSAGSVSASGGGHAKAAAWVSEWTVLTGADPCPVPICMKRSPRHSRTAAPSRS